jgi:superfamily II DNA helicase RecQ
MFLYHFSQVVAAASRGGHEMSIVFCRSRAAADRVCAHLTESKCIVVHEDMEQRHKVWAVERWLEQGRQNGAQSKEENY